MSPGRFSTDSSRQQQQQQQAVESVPVSHRSPRMSPSTQRQAAQHSKWLSARLQELLGRKEAEEQLAGEWAQGAVAGK